MREKLNNTNENINIPLVTIVTPVFNGEKYLEETIKSILRQTYANIEYIVIDGGSMDGTLEIIKKYREHISYWVSEKDKGQADAINKGFSKASGEILAWLNYDDVYFPDTVENIVNGLQRSKASFTYGNSQLFDSNGKVFKTLYSCRQSLRSYQADGGNVFQGTVFFTKDIFQRHGLLDTTLKCSFEYKAFDAFYKFEKGVFINKVLAKYRIHDESISSNYPERFSIECKLFREKEYTNIVKFGYKIRRLLLNFFNGNLLKKFQGNS